VANVAPGQATAQSMALVRAVGAVAAQLFAFPGRPDELPGLTSRENDVLGWLCAGKTNQEIATIIGVRERTVKFHLENIYEKLKVTNRAQAIAKALRLELL
jgi:DNA-binding CsgD family transcriptional regulator